MGMTEQPSQCLMVACVGDLSVTKTPVTFSPLHKPIMDQSSGLEKYPRLHCDSLSKPKIWMLACTPNESVEAQCRRRRTWRTQPRPPYWPAVFPRNQYTPEALAAFQKTMSAVTAAFAGSGRSERLPHEVRHVAGIRTATIPSSFFSPLATIINAWSASGH
jgi:hypothetical protein